MSSVTDKETIKWIVRNAVKSSDFERHVFTDNDDTVPKTHREWVFDCIRESRAPKTQPSSVTNVSVPHSTPAAANDIDAVLDSIPNSLFPTLATRDTEAGSNKSGLQQKLLEILTSAFTKASAQNAFTVLWMPFTYNGISMRLVNTARYKTRDASPPIMWDINGSPAGGKGTFRDLDESHKIVNEDGGIFSVSIDQMQRLAIPRNLTTYKNGQVLGQTNSKVEGRVFDVSVTLWLWALRVDKGREYRLWLNERIANSAPTDLLRWKENTSE